MLPSRSQKLKRTRGSRLFQNLGEGISRKMFVDGGHAPLHRNGKCDNPARISRLPLLLFTVNPRCLAARVLKA